MFWSWPLAKVLRFYGDWLRALPKGTAVFAIHDRAVFALSHAAELANIAVPDDIALLGVGSGDSFDLRQVSISGIEFNGRQTVAKTLEVLQQCVAGDNQPAIHRVPAGEVVARRSTRMDPVPAVLPESHYVLSV